MTLNERITFLEQQVKDLISKLGTVQSQTQNTDKPPRTIIGGSRITGTSYPIDPVSGRGAISGGGVIWNSIEQNIPKINIESSLPDSSTKSYNQHSHSRYTGGALIKDVLEIVEIDWDNSINKQGNPITNKYTPRNWANIVFKKETNSNKQEVDKIGLLDLVFNADTSTWGVAAYEIDVKKCYLIERDADGVVALDSKGHQKRSPLYNEDQTKTSVIWDENAQCWRFYAAYAPGEP